MKNKEPIYFFVLGHHYLGGGGTIPPASDVEEFADILSRYGAKGTFYFDGIHVECLLNEDPGFFERMNVRGVCLGYHGEETHGPYPVLVDYLLKGMEKQDMIVTGLRWDDAVRAVEQRYTHAIKHGPVDPLTHKLDIRLGGSSDLNHTGGLALVQQAFGRDVDIITTHSVEAAPAGYAFSRLSSSRVAQATPPLAAHYAAVVGHIELEKPAMALGGEDALFVWYMNKLNTKEYKEDEIMVLVGTPFEDACLTLQALDRQRPHIVSILMLDGPENTKDNFKTLIKYIATEFIPEDGCSRFIDPRDMLAIVEPPTERLLTHSILKEIASTIAQQWNGRPPDWLKLDQGDFSLVNAFEGLALGLAAFHKSTLIPPAVRNTDLLGPIGEPEEVNQLKKGSIQLVDLLSTIQGIVAEMYAQEPHRLPYTVNLSGRALNTAELLLVLARAYLTISDTPQQTEIAVEPAEITPPYADILQKLFHPEDVRPLWYSKLQLWTVKPARLRSI